MPATHPIAPSASGRIAGLLAARRNYRAEVLAMTQSKRFVAFYGCGAIFGGIVECWRDLVGRKINFCCDADPSKWHKNFWGIPCISPSELEKMKGDVAIFVTVGDFEPVLKYLSVNKFPCVQLIYKYDLFSSDYLSRPELDLGEVASKLELVRSMLADERSAQVFDAIVSRHLDSGSPPGLMAEICEGDQYFPPDLIRLRPDEAFVDAGAFTGDTLCDFARRSGGVFDSVRCFELDVANFQALQTTSSSLPGAEKIFLHAEGLWNEPLDISYNADRSRSSVGTGDARAHVVRLDDVVGNGRVTFLKMDIEGAELKALEGARETILANRPKLAICVYHHLKDLWEIPLVIKSLVPEYRIFLRHHTKLDYETVCYALPPEDVCG